MSQETTGGMLQELPYLAKVVLDLQEEVRALSKVTRELERQLDRMGVEEMKKDHEDIGRRVSELEKGTRIVELDKTVQGLEKYKERVEGKIAIWKLVSIGLWSVAMALGAWALARTH